MTTPERLLTAEQVVATFFPDDPVIDARWVRTHCPRVELTRGVVRYRMGAVAAWIAERERAA